MTMVDVEITRPTTAAAQPDASGTPEPAGVVIVEDVEALTTGALPGCGDDNPYT